MPLHDSPVPPVAAVGPIGMAETRRTRRIGAAFIFVGCASVLGVAAWLTPDASGIGTHQQLHLAPCGWTTGLGIPCPTCGMTTAFAHAANGNLLRSFLAQPFGCLLAIATAAATVVAAYVAGTGSALGGHLFRAFGPKMGWYVLGLALAAWAYKIASFRGLLP